MALAIVYSRATFGISAPLVTVEIHISNGLVGLNIVGLAEAAVKESKDRVRSALLNSRFEFPAKRITINLAPADLPKEGGRFDLPIALGILAASGQIPKEVLTQHEFIGELALSGELRGVRGVLPVVLAAHQSNRQLIVPKDNEEEAALITSANVLTAKHLLDVCMHLKNETKLAACKVPRTKITKKNLDLTEVKGQPHAKRALEIAAAGKHSLLFIGPPGTGKTMLASRIISILPPIAEKEALEVAAITSVSSKGFNAEDWSQIPFRSPHHSSSSIALVGGGRPPKPGEISLAHHGILFLDELPEFNRHVLECLREPLESGAITISRASHQTIFPAEFQLIAAMNPCPCGYAGSRNDECQCSEIQIKKYMGKISGPLLDRMDMHVEVARLQPELLAVVENGEESALVKKRVEFARSAQEKRQGKCNAKLSVAELDCFIELTPSARQLLNKVMSKFNLSARVYHRMSKVARTIADLLGDPVVNERHIAEALNYRCLDKMRSTT